MTVRAVTRTAATLLAVILLGAALLGGPLTTASAQEGPAPAAEDGPWDVLVVGSEPEGIAAAVAAAESGARTALVTQDARLGGLFVLGELNVLDVRTRPRSLQQGLFARWWSRVGGGHAFDVARAEGAFHAMLDEAGVTVTMGVAETTPIVDGGRVRGVALADGTELRARQVIDADADMRLAHAAGAPSTFGWRGFGLDARMADTLVLRLEGVDWQTLRTEARSRGAEWALADATAISGAFGGIPAAYPPRDASLRLRGLNLGRQDDGSVLVNALLIYGVDPFDPDARAAARARARAEAPHVVAYLAERLPGFAEARYAGAAPRLYVRETRHLAAECVLDADHLLDHVTGPFDVAVGGYPMDLQSLGPSDSGFVFGTPDLYGVPLCVTVPRELDGLWVVGRSAGYDPVAHSSARVVPLGMAVAEGVGVAAARAASRGMEPREVATSSGQMAVVRARLRARGAYLPMSGATPPAGPHRHPHHAAYRLLLGRGLALGGYDNEPRLDEGVPAISHVYMLANVAQRYFFVREPAQRLVAELADVDGPLRVEQAVRIQRTAACLLLSCPDGADADALAAHGLWPDSVPRAGALARGEMYALAAAIARRGVTGDGNLPCQEGVPAATGASAPRGTDTPMSSVDEDPCGAT